MGNFAIQFEMPSGAVRSKVPTSSRPVHKRKAGSGGLLRKVEVVDRVAGDGARSVQRSDRLLRKAAEGVRAERHGIIEHAGSASEDRPLVFVGSPHKATARSGARSKSNGLLFEAHSQVQGELCVQHPMVLRVYRGSVIGESERFSACKIDALQGTSSGVLKIGRASC